MKPPICEICDEKFHDDHLNQDGQGGLVEFKPTTEDKEAISRLSRLGMTGHPPNLGWFCKQHIEDARALRHLSVREAVRTIRLKLNQKQA